MWGISGDNQRMLHPLLFRLVVWGLVGSASAFMIFLGWALREAADQFGLWAAGAISVVTFISGLCIAALFDDRQARAQQSAHERSDEPADH